MNHIAIIAESESPLGFLSQFDVEWQMLASQALSFAIVAAALYYFVFRPVIKTAQQRQDEIQKGLDDAKNAATALENAQKNADEKLAAAIAESAKILKQAREQAKETVDAAAAEAAARAAEIREKNEAQIQSDREKMKRQLRGELAEIAARAAEKAVAEILTDEQRARLSEAAAKKLEL